MVEPMLRMANLARSSPIEHKAAQINWHVWVGNDRGVQETAVSRTRVSWPKCLASQYMCAKCTT